MYGPCHINVYHVWRWLMEFSGFVLSLFHAFLLDSFLGGVRKTGRLAHTIVEGNFFYSFSRVRKILKWKFCLGRSVHTQLISCDSIHWNGSGKGGGTHLLRSIYKVSKASKGIILIGSAHFSAFDPSDEAGVETIRFTRL